MKDVSKVDQRCVSIPDAVDVVSNMLVVCQMPPFTGHCLPASTAAAALMTDADSVDAVQRAADNIIQQKDQIIEWYTSLHTITIIHRVKDSQEEA